MGEGGGEDVILECRDVTRRYAVSRGFFAGKAEVRAVDGVSFGIKEGETLGLVGESGCGKSTLGRVILGLEPPSSGRVLFRGKDVAAWDEKDFRRRVQMIFQDPYSSLNPRQRIADIVAEGLVVHRMGDARRRRERVEEILGLVGLLPEHGRRYPHEFSGGQRQRVAIARALAVEPELVVCDEPVSALDVSVQAQVLNLLADLRRRLGLTYVFVSHALSVVGHVSDRVAVMYLGRFMELAPAADFFAGPLHPYSQALLAAAPVPDPDAPAGPPPLAGDPPSPMNPLPGCPFHPRCPRAFAPCPVKVPAWRETSPGRFVACHLHDPQENP